VDALAEPARPDFDEVWRAHGQAMGRWASRLSGGWVDPGDVVQEVLMVVHRRLPDFRGDPARLPAWLFRITQNVVRQRRRREKLRRWWGGGARDVAGHLEFDGPTPQESLEQRELRARANRVLDRLSEKHRTVLLLFEVEQLSGQEISELLSMKLATVWVDLHRARRKFMQTMRELEAQESSHD